MLYLITDNNKQYSAHQEPTNNFGSIPLSPLPPAFPKRIVSGGLINHKVSQKNGKTFGFQGFPVSNPFLPSIQSFACIT